MSATSSEQPHERGLRFEDGPITLIGPPTRCRGVLRVHNPNDCKVRFSRLRLRIPELPSTSCDESDHVLRAGTTLCARETRELRARLDLAPSTPAGVYAGEVVAEKGCEQQVVVHVLALRRTRFLPPMIQITSASGATFQVKVTLSNLGNVAAHVVSTAPLEVEDAENELEFHARAAVKAHGEEGHVAFLDSLSKRFAQAELAAGHVKVLEGAGALAPQHSRVLALEITLPKKLRDGGRYRATTRIADSTLHFRVHVSAPIETSSHAG